MKIRGINLLPWREELKEVQKKQFITILVTTIIFAGAVVLLGHTYMSRSLSKQNEVNKYIQKKIAELDMQIAEIQILKEERRRLLEHIKLIEALQTNRPLTVNIYENIVKILPQGVYLTNIKRDNDAITMVGKSESNSRISELMRNIENSKSLTNPVLTEIQTDEADKNYSKNFILVCQQTIKSNGTSH